jgi:hypothetical protein
VTRLTRVGAAVGRGAALLVPAGRRDWVAAIWAEALEAPPGLRRLAWRAAGARLIAREALMRRGIRSAMLFAVAAAVAARAAWPGSSANSATPADRLGVITMVALLAGLPLLARWFLGPPDNRPARWLRAGCYAGFLILVPAETAVDQFLNVPPRGGVDLRLYRFIAGWSNRNNRWGPEIVYLVLMALYLAAILWATSRRSRIAPATLASGTGGGIVLGLVMYTVAPLGLSNSATNPWLPGSDVDPLILLAWLLVLFGPAVVAMVADRRYLASSSSPPPFGARVRQMLAAGLLTSMTGALLVAVLSNGTTAVMLKAAWLRNWLYHGPHLLYGVQNLSSDLRTSPAVAYSHQLTGAEDAGVFLVMCIAFPVLGLLLTSLIAVCRMDAAAAAGQAGPRPGGGGPSGPEPAPGPPDDGPRTVTDDDAGPAAGWPGPHEPGPAIEQDWLVTDLADAALQPVGMR